MASTYSDLKIQLMATGENSGTWGTITNTNLGTAIEEAITGSADVAFSSADVTLTLTNTNETQTARNLRLNLTGTSGGNRNLIVPAIEKVYIINNGLANQVTVKNATGTGIVVPAGKTMYVYNNVTNVVDAITHLTSLTLGSPLPVASGGTGSTTAAFSGANITNLNATNVSSGTLNNARTTGASANTANALVLRDASGNFSAGTVTAALTGNSSTATALQTARTLTIGSTGKTFNGTANVAWSLTEIGVNNATLTMATSGIATGSQTFSANQSAAATFTVNVPGTNIAEGTRTTTTVPITSSTGSNATLSAASTTLAGVMSSADKTKLDGIAAGAQVNVPTNLGAIAGTTAGPTITSSTGTNVVIPTASGTASGIITTGAQTWAGVKTFSSTITGSISGNAGTATTLQTARTINGISFNGSANITVEPFVEDAVTTSVTRYVTFVDDSAAGFKRLNEDANFTYNPGTNVLSVPTFSGALSGNATTATTLQTARTINGTSFNGSANITTANWGTTRTLWGNSVNGSANITGALRPAAGSVSAPAFSTSADTNTGIFFPAADEIAFAEGGVESMRIDSSGNVGIGISAPGAKLQINGTSTSGTVSNISNFSGLRIDGNIANTSVTGITSNPGGGGGAGIGFGRGTSFDTFVNFYTNTSVNAVDGGMTERMRISADGNVGIGTSSPVTAFGRSLTLYNDASTGTVASNTYLGVQSLNRNAVVDLVGPAGATNAVTFSSTPGTTVAGVAASITDQNLIFRTGGTTERLRIDSSGNVGIGASTPSSFGQLAVVSNAVNKSAITAVSSSTSASDLAKFTFFHSGNDIFTLEGGLGLIFKQSGINERMRIDASGRLCLGTTSSTITGFTCRQTISYAGGGDEFGLGFRPTTDNTTAVVFSNAAGSAVGSITVTATTTSYNTTSDYRLKEDAKPVLNPIDRLMQLKPINFAWKVDGSRTDGFLAHEAQAVVPEAVTGEKDAVDKDGKPVHQRIDQSKLVPLLTAALQDAIKRIEQLELQINSGV